MASSRHRYQGSTVKPGCCIVLLVSGGDRDGQLWGGDRDQAEVIRRCGQGPGHPSHAGFDGYTPQEPKLGLESSDLYG